jgi:hypothetical protein
LCLEEKLFQQEVARSQNGNIGPLIKLESCKCGRPLLTEECLAKDVSLENLESLLKEHLTKDGRLEEIFLYKDNEFISSNILSPLTYVAKPECDCLKKLAPFDGRIRKEAEYLKGMSESDLRREKKFQDTRMCSMANDSNTDEVVLRGNSLRLPTCVNIV